MRTRSFHPSLLTHNSKGINFKPVSRENLALVTVLSTYVPDVMLTILEEMCLVSIMVDTDKDAATENRMNWNHLIIHREMIPEPLYFLF